MLAARWTCLSGVVGAMPLLGLWISRLEWLAVGWVMYNFCFLVGGVEVGEEGAPDCFAHKADVLVGGGGQAGGAVDESEDYAVGGC